MAESGTSDEKNTSGASLQERIAHLATPEEIVAEQARLRGVLEEARKALAELTSMTTAQIKFLEALRLALGGVKPEKAPREKVKREVKTRGGKVTVASRVIEILGQHGEQTLKELQERMPDVSYAALYSALNSDRFVFQPSTKRYGVA